MKTTISAEELRECAEDVLSIFEDAYPIADGDATLEELIAARDDAGASGDAKNEWYEKKLMELFLKWESAK